MYRKAEQEKDGTWKLSRYATCTYDACELICKAHENLHHARKYITLTFVDIYTNFIGVRPTYDRLHENYYGITEAQVAWVLEKYAICPLLAPNKSKPPIQPIKVLHCLHHLVIDLIDFTS